jgi:hypothetical protein
MEHQQIWDLIEVKKLDDTQFIEFLFVTRSSVICSICQQACYDSYHYFDKED